MTDQNKTHGVLTDAEIIALNDGEKFFSVSESRFAPHNPHLQYHTGEPGLIEFARALEAAVLAKAAPQSPVAPADDAPTIADYEEVLADHRRLVRELDVLLNGDGAAKQASLCDLVSQARRARLAEAPTVSATDAHKAGMLEAIGICLDQVGKAGENFDREIGVRSCVTAIGEEVKAKYGRPYPIDAAPTPPTSADDAVDAERYRWYRTSALMAMLCGKTPEQLDAEADAAIAASKEQA